MYEPTTNSTRKCESISNYFVWSLDFSYGWGSALLACSFQCAVMVLQFEHFTTFNFLIVSPLTAMMVDSSSVLISIQICLAVNVCVIT